MKRVVALQCLRVGRRCVACRVARETGRLAIVDSDKATYKPCYSSLRLILLKRRQRENLCDVVSGQEEIARED